jgi:hypothetical protein
MDPRLVTIAVEGDADASMVRRLVQLTNLVVGSEYVLRGKGNLDKKLPAYNKAAEHACWLVLRDLDRDASCAPSLIPQLLPSPAAHMHLRVAVRAAEAWLLADPDGLSRFLKVGKQSIPMNPESLDDPKQALVNVARHSRDRAIREDMVPEQGTTTRVGAGYTSRIIEFASRHWDPGAAARNSESLLRCIQALQRWHVQGTAITGQEKLRSSVSPNSEETSARPAARKGSGATSKKRRE